MQRSLVFLLLLFVGCKKDTDIIPSEDITGSVSIHIEYAVDKQPLLFNNAFYTNEAGEEYSVSKLQYYLSGFRFYKDKKLIQEIDSVFYIDANIDSANSILLPRVIMEVYDSVAFCVGLTPERSISYALPPTVENTNMAWPETMGGGYHFLKLEGHWKDSVTQVGFAMHLGGNSFQAYAGLSCHLPVYARYRNELKIRMNINEWFSRPNSYSLGKDGVYSMGNDTLMRKIAENGRDVFTAL